MDSEFAGRIKHKDTKAQTRVSSSEPQAQRGLQAAHWIRAIRQPELRVCNRGVPALKRDVIENISRVHSQVDIVAIAPRKRPAQRCVQIKLRGTGNGIS